MTCHHNIFSSLTRISTGKMCSNSNDTSMDTLVLSEKTFFEERFQRLAESDINSDCEFIVCPEKAIIKGHRMMFCAASDVFQAMFYGQLRENNSVKVEDLNPGGFQAMKTFIYTGKVTFKCSFHALSTFIAARKYLVPELGNVCINFIEEKLQSSEVLEFCDLCKLNRITEFDELCLKIIIEETDEVVDSEYFVLAEPSTIELLLKSPSLKLNSEIEVFDHFERWAFAEAERKKITPNNIASSFNNLKKHIRFLTISGDEFVSKVGESVLLTEEEKLAIAFNQIKPDSKLMPDTLSILQCPRDFDPSYLKYHRYTHSFSVPIVKANNSPSGYKITSSTSNSRSLTVYWSYFVGLICFKLKTSFSNMKTMFVTKSKFIVKAVTGCAASVVDNECKSIVNRMGKLSSQVNEIVLIVIPLSKLKNEHFQISAGNKIVNIVGIFSVKQINL